MASIVLGAVGAAVGGYAGATFGFGAVQGAAWGWSIGSAVGTAIAPPDQPSIEGPRATDLMAMTSQYGIAIPDVQGTMVVAGNVIWSTPITEVTSTEEVGGKGGGGQEVTTHSYYVSMAILLSEGEGYGGAPIIGVSEIWFDQQLYYIADDTADAAALYASNQRIPYVTVYTGTETQLPDPTMEAYEGVGNVPAYRGEAYIVFQDLPLVEPYFGRRPNVTCKVVKGGAVVGMREITTNAVISGTKQAVIGHRDGLALVARSDGTEAILDLSGNQVGSSAPATIAGACFSLPILNYSSSSDVATRMAYGYAPFCSAGWWARDNKGVTYPVPNLPSVTGPPLQFGAIVVDDAIYVILYRDNELNGAGYIVINKYGNGLFLASWSEPEGERAVVHYTGAYDPVLRQIHLWESLGDLHRVLSEDLALVAEHTWALSDATLPTAAVNGNDVVIVNSGSPGSAEWYQLDGSYDHTLVDSAVVTSSPGVSIAPRFLTDTLVETGFGVVRLADGITITEPTEGELVLHYALQAGLSADELDVTAGTGTVHGITRSRVCSARTMIEHLQKHGWFDFVEADGILRLVKRGGASVATISEDDLGVHAWGSQYEPPLYRTRSQELELPQRYTVNFVEPAADYQQGSAQKQRTHTTSNMHIVEDLPIAMSAQKGADIATVLLTDAWNSRESLEFTAGQKWAAIEPCDPITIGSTHRVRIISKYAADGALKFRAATEQAAIYTPNASATASTVAQSIVVRGPTSLDMPEIPLLRDEDDGIASYALLDGYLAGWSGAALLRSTDGGTTWAAAGSVSQNAKSGFAATVLAAWMGGNVVDNINTVDVTMRSGDTLSSTTYDGMLASRTVNACVIGTEVLQYRTATLLSGTTYRLSGLLRYRGGTEDATHAIGDVFFALATAGILPIGSAADLGLSRSYEAVTVGSTLGTGTRKSITHACRTLKPLPVINFAAGSDGASGILFQWIAQHRKDTIWRNFVDVPEDDAPTSFALDILDSSYASVKRTIATSTPSAAYTYAQMTADGLAYAASIGTRCYKISPSVGRGIVAQNTITLPGIAPTLLLHFDGADASTTFTDEAGHTVTPSGNVQIDTAQSKFGGASGLWDGVDDKLTIADSADWNFSTGDWTIEFFCRSMTSGIIVGQANDLGAGSASWAVSTNGTTYMGINASTGGGSWNLIAIQTATYSPINFGDGTWRHVAVVCDYPTVWIFVDGVQYAFGTLAGAMPDSAHALTIGNGVANNNDLSGWLDEMRIVKGTAIYLGGASASNNGTTYFTPPSAPF